MQQLREQCAQTDGLEKEVVQPFRQALAQLAFPYLEDYPTASSAGQEMARYVLVKVSGRMSRNSQTRWHHEKPGYQQTGQSNGHVIIAFDIMPKYESGAVPAMISWRKVNHGLSGSI